MAPTKRGRSTEDTAEETDGDGVSKTFRTIITDCRVKNETKERFK